VRGRDGGYIGDGGGSKKTRVDGTATEEMRKSPGLDLDGGREKSENQGTVTTSFKTHGCLR